jgi:hypothetical protein
MMTVGGLSVRGLNDYGFSFISSEGAGGCFGTGKWECVAAMAISLGSAEAEAQKHAVCTIQNSAL